MMPAYSIQSVLRTAADQLTLVSDVPQLEVELLLSFVMHKTREFFFAYPETQLTPENVQKFMVLLSRRLQGEPLAYILGKREFWSLDLHVSPDVLIPRPETEALVSLTLDHLKNQSEPCVLELGTGSAAVALSIALERKDATLCAVDCSPAALLIAEKNAKHHGVTSIQFILSDWFSAVPLQRFDAIVCNPPYLSHADGIQFGEDLKYEPASALYAGQDGLDALRVIIKQSPFFLKQKGMLIVEHGHAQGDVVRNLFFQFGFINVCTINDLNCMPRITRGELIHHEQ